MSKNFIVMEKKVCPICQKVHNHKCGILIHKRLGNIDEDRAVTGLELCEEHDKLWEDGYICLIGCDESQSDVLPNGNIKYEGAYSTGEIVHMHKRAIRAMFEGISERPFMFCDTTIIQNLKEQHEKLSN